KIMRIACKNCEEKDEYIAQQMTDGVKSWLVETKRMYTCTFSFRGEYCATGSYDGIGEFTDGFLVDKDCKLTKGSDCVCWIPPGKIEDIEIEEITVRLSEK
ncbi:MAG: hypothetical protein KAT90_03865, partial [Gammaproteobacteria bacterium]|nr:hypothetical protein [Gammaproteobacteria bacterium]